MVQTPSKQLCLNAPGVWSPELPSALSRCLPALPALSALAISSPGPSSGHRSSFTNPEPCERDHGVSAFVGLLLLP